MAKAGASAVRVGGVPEAVFGASARSTSSGRGFSLGIEGASRGASDAKPTFSARGLSAFRPEAILRTLANDRIPTIGNKNKPTPLADSIKPFDFPSLKPANDNSRFGINSFPKEPLKIPAAANDNKNVISPRDFNLPKAVNENNKYPSQLTRINKFSLPKASNDYEHLKIQNVLSKEQVSKPAASNENVKYERFKPVLLIDNTKTKSTAAVKLETPPKQDAVVSSSSLRDRLSVGRFNAEKTVAPEIKNQFEPKKAEAISIPPAIVQGQAISELRSGNVKPVSAEQKPATAPKVENTKANINEDLQRIRTRIKDLQSESVIPFTQTVSKKDKTLPVTEKNAIVKPEEEEGSRMPEIKPAIQSTSTEQKIAQIQAELQGLAQAKHDEQLVPGRVVNPDPTPLVLTIIKPNVSIDERRATLNRMKALILEAVRPAKQEKTKPVLKVVGKSEQRAEIKKPEKERRFIVDAKARQARTNLVLSAIEKVFGKRKEQNALEKAILGTSIRLPKPSNETISEIVKGGPDGSLPAYVQKVRESGLIYSTSHAQHIAESAHNGNNPVATGEAKQNTVTNKEVQIVLGGRAVPQNQDQELKPAA